MKILFACEFCGAIYETSRGAMKCEFSHSNLFLNDSNNLSNFCSFYLNKDICDFCKHAYYVYGCELDCQKKECQMNRNRPDFVLNKDKFEEETKKFKERYDL